MLVHGYTLSTSCTIDSKTCLQTVDGSNPTDDSVQNDDTEDDVSASLDDEITTIDIYTNYNDWFDAMEAAGFSVVENDLSVSP